MSLYPGDILDGKYRILSILGKGGMGVVYLAENTRVRRQVAIKVLLKETISAAEDAVVRFEREAQAAGRIGSEHIVEVLDLGVTHDGDRFMVMELLEGDTLKQRLTQGRLSQDRVAGIFGQLLDGLSAAHAASIIHRDLKPDNVFLQKSRAGQRDWVKILDFGISKFNDLSAEEGRATRTGVVMGTPFYMSAEQIRSTSSVDARSDLYAVAVMLFEALTGQVPFQAGTMSELMFKIVFETHPHPKSIMPTLGEEICAIIMKGMQRDPAARFQSAEEFKAALETWSGRIDERPSMGPSSTLVLQAPSPRSATAATAVDQPPSPSSPLLSVATQVLTTGPESAVIAGARPAPSKDTQPEVSALAAQSAGKKTGLFVAIAVALMIGGGLIAFLAFRSHARSTAALAPFATTASAASLTPIATTPATTVTLNGAAAETTAPDPSAGPLASASGPATTAPVVATVTVKAAVAPKPSTSPATVKKPVGGVVTDYGY